MLLSTKLYVPAVRPELVSRPRLIERLNAALRSRLTLISAAAGFGKTSLVSAWVAGCGRPVAWLSLDAGDSDLTRFLAYLVAALQTIAPHVGEQVLAALQSPQPPPTEWMLTALLNDITTVPDSFVLVLDDYHVIEAKSVDDALGFLIEHLPPQMHLIIATREDPRLPLARLRARDQLNELRAADLRFNTAEAAGFLNQVMGLNLSAEDVARLETRTEGWIAGLQLAAISMRGQKDTASFITAFAGSHHFVLDYLMEEVLQHLPDNMQTFLLRTSMLDRLCGPLCDAVLLDQTASGQKTLAYLERANLFIVPLDDQRRWYRYHHLFAEFLRQRLQQSADVAECHIRASQWYEDNGLAMEAFRHAVEANDIERAERLMEGKEVPLHFLGAVNTFLVWLASLPQSVLDARPLLWVRSATMALTAGQTSGVEEKCEAAEKALANAELDPQTRDLYGQIACARATLAVTRYDPETVAFQAHRALEYLLPENRRFRFTANWALSAAHQLQGDRAAASRALSEALSGSEAPVSMFSTILALSQLGHLQEVENQLYRAAETYRRVLQIAGAQPGPNTNDAHLGLARICYEWNDLDAAQQYAQKSLQMARLYDRVIDRFVISDVFLARLKLAQGDVDGAVAMLAEAERSVRQNNFERRLPDVAAVQVLTLLQQGNLAAAARLAQAHDLPISRARVLLAQGDPAAALAVLEPWRQQMEAKAWQDERLKAMVLQAVALQAHGEKGRAAQALGEALALAEPGGFIRLFVDEGLPMARLLSEAAMLGIMPNYIGRLLPAFGVGEQPILAERQVSPPQSQDQAPAQPLVEPLSQRELEVLRLVAQGLANREIGERLYLALDTVKGHNRRIFAKLGVQSRTEAIARARELGLL